MTAIETLYHYTTPDGLIGIIRDNSLWATSAFYLNDAQELLGGVQLAHERLRCIRDAATDAHQAELIDWLLHRIRDVGTAERMTAYVCSLSANGDLLSQWRAYCRGGGFAIAFPADQLRNHVAAQQFALCQCAYSVDDHNKLINDTLERVALPWTRMSQSSSSEGNERFKVSGKLVWELIRTASQLKNASFAEERESRIVSQPEKRFDAEKLHFRTRNGLIVPYTTAQLPDADNIEFWSRVSVIIGPTPHPDESKRSVYDLVRRYRGHAIGIATTTTPYREW